MGGDLNSTPESAVQDSVRNAGYRDAWQLCGQGDGFTFPAAAGIKRIDYLYLDDQSGCDEASVLNTDASDHSPVLIRVRLRPS
jgi:endonuclease/exonuclease/phosphatase (EEP) superfamily protein YafD